MVFRTELQKLNTFELPSFDPREIPLKRFGIDIIHSIDDKLDNLKKGDLILLENFDFARCLPVLLNFNRWSRKVPDKTSSHQILSLIPGGVKFNGPRNLVYQEAILLHDPLFFGRNLILPSFSYLGKEIGANDYKVDGAYFGREEIIDALRTSRDRRRTFPFDSDSMKIYADLLT